MDGDVRAKVAEALRKARADAAIFAVTTVLLTPAFIAAALVGLLFALEYADLPVIDYLGYGLSIVTGVNLTLIFMAGSYFMRAKAPYQRGRSDRLWVGIGLAILCGLLALSYATPLPQTVPGLFWPIHISLALAMLGCIGHAYEPCESYYLGWTVGPFTFDNPFTIEDDIDRAHLSLGFAAAFPRLILGSYAAIFGSTWLWRGLDEREVSAAAELLEALASKDAARAESGTRALGHDSALRVVRALVKMELVSIGRGSPRLALEGEKLLGLSQWH